MNPRARGPFPLLSEIFEGRLLFDLGQSRPSRALVPVLDHFRLQVNGMFDTCSIQDTAKITNQ
jgi:hypothetical protein